MTLERFEGLIDTQGSNLSTWAEEERSQATILLQESAKAKDLLKHALQVDAALATDEAPVASDRLKSDVFADAHRVLTASNTIQQTKAAKVASYQASVLQRMWTEFAELFSPWAPQVATILVIALIGGIAAGTFVSTPSVDQEVLVAAYGADEDYWMNELDPAFLEANGGEI